MYQEEFEETHSLVILPEHIVITLPNVDLPLKVIYCSSLQFNLSNSLIISMITKLTLILGIVVGVAGLLLKITLEPLIACSVRLLFIYTCRCRNPLVLLLLLRMCLRKKPYQHGMERNDQSASTLTATPTLLATPIKHYRHSSSLQQLDNGVKIPPRLVVVIMCYYGYNDVMCLADGSVANVI